MKSVAISILSMMFWVCQVTAQTTDMLYIFPNKDIYETGEDMWFKAYLMDRQTLALSDRSQTLYLQVRSETGKVVWSEKYPLTSGRGDGHIYIGENWLQEEYYLEGSLFFHNGQHDSHPSSQDSSCGQGDADGLHLI